METESMNKSATTINANIIANATKWSFATEIGAKFVAPVINMILARLIAPSAFGIVATVNMVVSLANVFTEAGFRLYIVQHEFTDENDLHNHMNTAFWTSCGIGLLAFLFIAIFRDTAARLVGSPEHGNAIMVASISIPFVAMISILSSGYQRDFDFKTLFFRRIVVLLTPFIVTIPLAFLGLAHWALIIGTICGYVTNMLVLLLRSSWRIRFFFSWSQLKRMVPFSVTSMGGYLASWGSSWADVFIVSHILGDYFTGLYRNAQSTVTGILATITAALTPVLFNVLCRYQNNQELFVGTLVSFTQKLSIFLIPIGVGFLTCSEYVTTIILGTQWMEAAPFIGVWGFCLSLNAVYSTYAREACRAKGKPYLPLITQLIHIGAMIPACYYAAKGGFTDLIYVRSIVSLIIIPIYYIIYFFVLNISPLSIIRVTLSPWFAATVMGVLAYFLMRLTTNLFIQTGIVLLCAGIYFLTLMMFPEYRRKVCKTIEEYFKKRIDPESR